MPVLFVTRVALVVFFAIFTVLAPAHAQTTANISGSVTDQTSGVLPGVTVTATNTENGFSRNAANIQKGAV